MTLKFYYIPMSTAMVTKAVLEELGVDYEEIILSVEKGDTKSPEFRKVNPNGKVPTIVHDGNPVWESAAITLYLGETFGVEKGLYPPPGIQRGNAMKWTVWAACTLGKAASNVYAASMKPESEREAATKEAMKAMDECLGILEEKLQEDYILGDKFSVVDANLQSLIGWIAMMNVPLESKYPRTHKWLKTCQARPALAPLYQP